MTQKLTMTGTNKKSVNLAICAAFEPGLELVSFLTKRSLHLKFVATSQRDLSPYEPKIAKICQDQKIKILRKTNTSNQEFIDNLKKFQIDLVILAWWPNIIKSKAIKAAKIGWVNLHPSLLPYGKGKHAYYWSIVDGTLFGVSIHFIDQGIDTGPVLFQRQVSVAITDTGESLYQKGVKEVIKLFKQNYSKIVNLQFKPKQQDSRHGSYHHSCEIEPHSQIILDKKYQALDLINILRARTFNQGPSAYFFHQDKKYLAKISIQETDL